jgi:DNA-directed RNA polymerases I and III subunit RPAC1
MPEIILKRNFYDEEAETLKSCFSPGVIGLIDDEVKHGRKKAIVVNSRKDMCSRQAFMYDEFKDSISISKIRNHFICKCLFWFVFFLFKLFKNVFFIKLILNQLVL